MSTPAASSSHDEPTAGAVAPETGSPTGQSDARIFGAAIFSGTDALSQLWAFIVFPLVGSALGVVIWLVVHDTKLEDTICVRRRMPQR
jgi:hypothetical protein